MLEMHSRILALFSCVNNDYLISSCFFLKQSNRFIFVQAAKINHTLNIVNFGI